MKAALRSLARIGVLLWLSAVLSSKGSTSKIVYQELPTDDPKVRQPDITRARTKLGWEPTVPLEEGLVKTIDYFKKKMGLDP